MTEPTVEEVREALERWDQWDDDDLSIGKDHPFWPMVAVTRLWVAAAELTQLSTPLSGDVTLIPEASDD